MFEGFAETEQTSNSPEYQVLARRTRPQSFSQLVGQESAVRAIEGMIQSGRIPHAFLFTGTRGTGKTSSARILAKSLCCEHGPTLEPCQTCTHCVQITASAHEDVFEIDGASHTGVDNIRELRESARFFPQSSRYKIFIIDEVHMLSMGAFNALLKTLEEPPPQVVFILATTELHKVPVTVRSRCMILSFRKIDAQSIAQHLAKVLEKDNLTYDTDALQLIAREAKGSLRDSLSLLEQVLALGSHRSVTFEAAKAALSVMGEGICQSLFQGILRKDAQMCFEALADIDASSLDFSHLLEQTSLLFRSAIIMKQAGQNQNRLERANEILHLLPSEQDLIQKASEHVTLVALIEIYRALAHASRDILRTNAQRAWAEITVMDCISRSEWLSADELSHLITRSVSQTADLGPLTTFQAKDSNTSQSQPKFTNKAPPAITVPSTAETLPRTRESASVNPVSKTGSEMLDLYATLMTQIQSQSVQLAVKLKHAKLSQFTKQKLIFSDCPENKLFAQLSESEEEIFLAALSAIDCAQCQIEGLDFPGKSNRIRPKTAPTPTKEDGQSKQLSLKDKTTLLPSPNQQAQANPIVSKSRPASKALEAIASLSREDPFGGGIAKHSDQKKNEAAPVSVGPEGVSLASVEQAEESRKWQARQAEVRGKPLLKKLEALGAEIEVIPLKTTERSPS